MVVAMAELSAALMDVTRVAMRVALRVDTRVGTWVAQMVCT